MNLKQESDDMEPSGVLSEITKDKDYYLSILKNRTTRINGTRDFDWSYVKMALTAILEDYCVVFRWKHRHEISTLLPKGPVHAFFYAIFDLVEKYGCVDFDLLNVFTTVYWRLSAHGFNWSLMKMNYKDRRQYEFVNPCFGTMMKGLRQSLEYLLQSGVEYFRPDADNPFELEICFTILDYLRRLSDGATSMRTDDLTSFRASIQEEDRWRIMTVFRTIEVILRFYAAVRYTTDPFSTRVQVWTVAKPNAFSVEHFCFEDEDNLTRQPCKIPLLPDYQDIDCSSSIEYLRCYRMVFNATPEPVVTVNEIARVLERCLIPVDDTNAFIEKFRKDFGNFFPESLLPLAPRSLQHLCKCQIRQTVRASRSFPDVNTFSMAVDCLPLPPALKKYVLLADYSMIHV